MFYFKNFLNRPIFSKNFNLRIFRFFFLFWKLGNCSRYFNISIDKLPVPNLVNYWILINIFSLSSELHGYPVPILTCFNDLKLVPVCLYFISFLPSQNLQNLSKIFLLNISQPFIQEEGDTGVFIAGILCEVVETSLSKSTVPVPVSSICSTYSTSATGTSAYLSSVVDPYDFWLDPDPT